VVVETSRAAAISLRYVRRLRPDGYTIYITAGGIAVNRFLFWLGQTATALSAPPGDWGTWQISVTAAKSNRVVG